MIEVSGKYKFSAPWTGIVNPGIGHKIWEPSNITDEDRQEAAKNREKFENLTPEQQKVAREKMEAELKWGYKPKGTLKRRR